MKQRRGAVGETGELRTRRQSSLRMRPRRQWWCASAHSRAPGLTGRPRRTAVSSAAGPEDIPSWPDALSSPVTWGSYSSQHVMHVRQCKILRLSGCKMQDSQSAEKLAVAHVSLLILTTRRRRSKSRLIQLKRLGLGILCTNLTSGFIFLSLFFLPSDFPTNLSSYIMCIFISCLNTDVEPGEKQMNWWVNLLIGRAVSSLWEQLHRIWFSFQLIEPQWDFLWIFPRGANAYCQWVHCLQEARVLAQLV